MKNKIALFGLGVCGTSAACLAVGLIARFSLSLIRLCGVAMLVSLVYSVWKIAQVRKA